MSYEDSFSGSKYTETPQNECYTPTRTITRSSMKSASQISAQSMETVPEPDETVTDFPKSRVTSPIIEATRSRVNIIDDNEDSTPKVASRRRSSIRRLSRRSMDDNEIIDDANNLKLFSSSEDESSESAIHNSRRKQLKFDSSSSGSPSNIDSDSDSSSNSNSDSSSDSDSESCLSNSNSSSGSSSSSSSIIVTKKKNVDLLESVPSIINSTLPLSRPTAPNTTLFDDDDDDEDDDSYGYGIHITPKNKPQSQETSVAPKQLGVSLTKMNENHESHTAPHQNRDMSSSDRELLATIPDCPETLTNGWLWDGESFLMPTSFLLGADPSLFNLHARSPAQLDPQRRGKYLSNLDGEDCICCPSRIYKHLMPHQRASVAWVLACYLRGEGGLLADDMGLGKTVTSSVAIGLLFKNRLASHIIVCVPLNVMQQWEDEIVKWAPEAEVFKLRGTTDKQRLRTLEAVIESPAGVLLINYDLMKRLSAMLQGIPSALKFDWYSEASIQNKKKFQKLLSKRDNDPRRCYNLPSLCRPTSFEPAEGPGWHPKAANSTDPEIHPLLQSRKETLVPWDGIIFDEAHTLKNPTTQVSEGALRIRSSCKLLLSGTPVYNKLDDFWGLLSIGAPGVLGEKKFFKNEFTNPITRGLARDAAPFEVALKDELVKKLKMQTAHVVLRRTKADLDVADNGGDATQNVDGQNNSAAPTKQSKSVLPPKVEMIVWQRMAPLQSKIYESLLKTETAIDALSKVKTETTGSSQFRLLSWLRKVSVCPLLLLPKGRRPWETDHTSFMSHKDLAADRALAAERKKKEREEASLGSNLHAEGGVLRDFDEFDDDEVDDQDELTETFQYIYNMEPNTESIIENCAKLNFVHKMLPCLIKSGHKVLIFSEFVYTLQLVAQVVLEDALGLAQGVDFNCLNGSIPIEEREAIIQDFKAKSDVKVLLASSKVGGVGLNLTVSDRILLLEPSWTPAIDSQVVDRVHRIGQTRKVVVYRLACAGTIEDHCLRLQLFKRGVHKAALEQSSRQQRYFKSDDMRGAFKLRDAESVESAKLMVAAASGGTSNVDLSSKEGQAEALQDKEVNQRLRSMNKRMAIALNMDVNSSSSLFSRDEKQNIDLHSGKELDHADAQSLMDDMNAIALTDFTCIHKSLEAENSKDAHVVEQARERASMTANKMSNPSGPISKNSHNGFLFGNSSGNNTASKSSKFKPIAPTRVIKYDNDGKAAVDDNSNPPIKNIQNTRNANANNSWDKENHYDPSSTKSMQQSRKAPSSSSQQQQQMMRTAAPGIRSISHRYPSYGGGYASNSSLDPDEVSSRVDELLSGFFK